MPGFRMRKRGRACRTWRRSSRRARGSLTSPGITGPGRRILPTGGVRRAGPGRRWRRSAGMRGGRGSCRRGPGSGSRGRGRRVRSRSSWACTPVRRSGAGVRGAGMAAAAAPWALGAWIRGLLGGLRAGARPLADPVVLMACAAARSARAVADETGRLVWGPTGDVSLGGEPVRLGDPAAGVRACVRLGPAADGRAGRFRSAWPQGPAGDRARHAWRERPGTAGPAGWPGSPRRRAPPRRRTWRRGGSAAAAACSAGRSSTSATGIPAGPH